MSLPMIVNPSPLGGGIQGFIPSSTYYNDKNDVYVQTRFTLRQAWNTNYISQLAGANKKMVTTPFRAVNNAGDLLSRQDYSCGGSCQTFQSRPGLKGLRFGSVQSNCDGTNIPPASCNVKYVYDSSDYTKYRKQKNIIVNYNDVTEGGDSNNSTQSALKAARRF